MLPTRRNLARRGVTFSRALLKDGKLLSRRQPAVVLAPVSYRSSRRRRQRKRLLLKVPNTFPQTPTSVAGSSDSCPGRTAYGAYERGNSVSNFQGCHFSGESLPTTIHFNTLSSGERTRDRGVPPCDQSKGTKQISSEGEVQNGGAPYCSLSSTQGRLYDETRPAGRLLCGPDIPGVEEISSFPVQGNNLRVPLPPIWPLPGPPSLHQNPPSDCRETAFRGDTNSYLLGRSSPDSPSEGHIERDLPLCEETFVQPGLPSETREMLSRTNSSLGLSGCGVRHNLHVSGSARGDRIQGACQEMLESRSTSLGGLSSLLGRMSHAARTGLWIASLYYRALQRQQALQLHQFGWRPRCQMLLSRPSLEDLRWWVSPTLHEHNSQDTPPPFDLTIRTDASLLGWGATCNGMSTGGRWSVEEAEQHINCLELKAAILALKAFLRVGMQPSPRSLGHHPPRHILLEMDNTTAVAYVNKRGGTQSPSLSLLASELWSFLLTQGSWVTARHLPGVLNVEADAASRVFNLRTEWMLRKDVFQDIAYHFYLPEIHLFASRLNHQLPLYVSRLPDPSAAAVDAFQQDWSQWNSFIHPPVVLLSRILQKVRSDKATALLVAPDWPGQPWYAQIQLMLKGAPYSLPKEKSLLTLPFDQEAVHPLWRSVNLTVWPISGQPTRRQVSLKR